MKEPVEWSPTKPFPQHEVYYPGTEELASDEMRVVACGTGMPQPRMAIPNEESFPAPPQREKEPPNSMASYQWTDFSLSGVERESAAATNAVIARFNEKLGTDVKPTVTGIPFQ